MFMISEVLWKEIESVIPTKNTKVGRPQNDQRTTLSGIFYMMDAGCQWRNLPDCYGNQKTVHGRFMIWAKTGVFEKIMQKSIDVAIKHLGEPECFYSDTSSAKAPFAKFGGKNPTDRGRNGVKKGIVIDINRIILSVLVAAANRHDSSMLIPHIPNLRAFLSSPKVMSTDSAWDVKKIYKELAKENIALNAATNVRRNKLKRKTKPGGRWRVEQVFGIQQWHRGIKFCWNKSKDSFLALYQFASAIHNFRLAGIFR